MSWLSPKNCSQKELTEYLANLKEGFLCDFDHSTYSQVGAEACCPTLFSDINQSAQSRLMVIASKSWQHGKKTGVFLGFQFLMTLNNSTERSGGDSSISSPADFPARTSPPQAKAPVSQESNPASGWKWRESSVKYDPGSRSWKTRQFSLLGDSEPFSETWPQWGTMRDGESWELPMSARPTFAKGSGLWPTPTASTYGSCQGGSAGRDGQPNSHYKMWPTPNATDYKGMSTRSKGKERPVCDDDLPTRCGGQLNPTWVEWLMGWPPEWTALKPSATDKSRSVPPKPGES